MMDENKLRWIAAVIIIAIGAAYMGWLVLSYLQSMRTQEYIKNTVDQFFSDRFAPPQTATAAAEVIPSEPES